MHGLLGERAKVLKGAPLEEALKMIESHLRKSKKKPCALCQRH
jgi:hypothetical protein